MPLKYCGYYGEPSLLWRQIPRRLGILSLASYLLISSVATNNAAAVPPSPPDLYSRQLKKDPPNLSLEKCSRSRPDLYSRQMKEDTANLRARGVSRDLPDIYSKTEKEDNFDFSAKDKRLSKAALYFGLLAKDRPSLQLKSISPTRANIYADQMKAEGRGDLDVRYIPRTRSDLSTRFMDPQRPDLYLPLEESDPADLRL